MGNCLRLLCFKDNSSTDLEEKFIDPRSDASSLASVPRKGRSGMRAFIFVSHATYGLLLLEAHKKRKGGRHFQLPGGHVDAYELNQYGDAEGSRVAAARELWEETGMDFRDRLYRLSPVDLNSMGPRGRELQDSGRRYFTLDISNLDSVDDIPAQAVGGVDGATIRRLRLATPLSMENFRLCLSTEHTGFKFQRSTRLAARDLAKHSGGTSSEAVLMCMSRDASTSQHSGMSADESGQDTSQAQRGQDTLAQGALRETARAAE
mmetsp:Transcript_7459/g.14989  ORF Transcript_7459/g.14989 Transcript_7459/m.14989 type:complete len:263 (+) Transcript_7459:173-961(+)|eukprot:CAMPEP_0196729662 /NCGR_PEP_ID=MMETSP1091-20130531/9988_1 /TAXON_ID=302021 /ORGANISM="Rhodomonas sp., Strain CCMP768" /LENGTH=262 /DNA_ID=CAMNT_0042072573 /DNA_START=171 /DNA_END=959 /DNA_ORIENTATION=-